MRARLARTLRSLCLVAVAAALAQTCNAATRALVATEEPAIRVLQSEVIDQVWAGDRGRLLLLTHKAHELAACCDAGRFPTAAWEREADTWWHQ